MSKRTLTLTLLLVVLLFSACQPRAEFDVRGGWEYVMTGTDGNTYDAGTITFSGQPERGTYLEVNIYQVEYEGEFTVNGSTLKLTGYETWVGTITDGGTLSGTWTREDGSNGTFTATRK